VANPAASALLAETRRKPGRLLLTGLAVIVATVFAAGTLLLSETLRAYLTRDVEQTPAAAAVVLVPGYAPGTLPGDDPAPDPVERVAAVDGVAQAVAVRSAYATTADETGAEWRVTSDPMSGPLSRLTAEPEQGHLPTSPDEAVIGIDTAARTGLGPGDTVTLEDQDWEPRTFTVAGVTRLPDDTANRMALVPDSVAALGGEVDQVDVAAAPGTDDAALAERVAAVAGPADEVRTGDEQRALELEETGESVTGVLVGIGVFAGLAVVAAAVVVASTFRIVLTQRRTQLALLRCVGARRGQVVRAVLAEAVLTGVVAGVLGVGIAVLAGYALLAWITSSGLADVPELVLWWPGLAGVLLVAVLTTVVAAVAPALAAARIPPVAALGAADAGDAGAPRTGGRALVGALLLAAAVGLAVIAPAAGQPGIAMVLVAVSGMVAFAALVVTGPVLVRALGATVGRVVAVIGGGPGRLAVANAAQVPRRTAATISVLALGVGLTSALLVGLGSAQAGAERSIDGLFPADIMVDAGGPDGASAVAEQLRSDPRLVVRVEGAYVLVNPAPGVDDRTARTAVEGAAAASPDHLDVAYAGDARAELETVLDTARMIGLGLVGMTVLVAVVGVVVTLMLSVTERTRETGLLRAVGLSRPGVRAMVAWEAALSGTAAAVLGAAIGAVYGLLGVDVLEVAAGVETVPVGQLAVLVAGVVAVAVLAALIPALRAGRVPPIRALQDA
jgi:putative ABC transport system permease protein